MEWYCDADMRQQIDAARAARDKHLNVFIDQTLERAKAKFLHLLQRVRTWTNGRPHHSAQLASSR
jgi:hypothetical protein